jgi:hypothetical protein
MDSDGEATTVGGPTILLIDQAKLPTTAFSHLKIRVKLEPMSALMELSGPGTVPVPSTFQL